MEYPVLVGINCDHCQACKTLIQNTRIVLYPLTALQGCHPPPSTEPLLPRHPRHLFVMEKGWITTLAQECSCIHPHQCCSSATKPFFGPLWKFPGKGPWLCMYKDHVCTCRQSGMFRTLESLLTCSGFSGLLLLPLPSGMLAGTDPAASCCHFSYEEITRRSPRPVGITSALPTPAHEKSRDRGEQSSQE